MVFTLRWRIAQFFEIRWWQRYLRSKDKWAYLNWKRAYWLDFLKKSNIQVPENASILDAGCGPAGIFMLNIGGSMDAFDPLLGEYRRLLPLFKEEDYPHVHFFESTLEDYAPQQQYDLVFCLNAINHVANIEQGFDQLVRFTRPGGTLAVSVDAHNYTLLERIFKAVPGDILHPHQYDLEAYKQMLIRRGCTLESTILIKKELIFNYYLLVAVI
jgi:2-polyprenyl-6-hydroxyphenyl methylase/3-demethylubiquinone-9 3-methyltransferase